MPALLFATFLCLGWLVSEHFPPWMAFHNEAPAFAGLIAAAALAAVQNRDPLGWRLGPGQFLLLLLVALAPVQYLAGQLPYAGDVWLTLTYGGGLVLAWTLGRLWAGEPRRGHFDPLETLALGFTVGASVSALMGITQALGQEGVWGPWLMSGQHIPRALANLGQPNQLATLLLMGLVALVVLRERDLISGPLLLLLAILLSSGVVLAQSRTSLLAATALAAWAWWRSAALRQLSRRSVLGWLLALWLCSALLPWLQQWLQDLPHEALAAAAPVARPNIRPLMWQQLLAAVSQSPWTGYGWLQTPAAQQAGALQVPGLEQVLYAHNHLLDLLVWLGIPLTLLLLALVARVLWSRRRALEESRVVLALAWLLPLAVHAMLEFPLAYAYFLLPAGVLWGMLDQWTRPADARDWRLPRAIVLLAVCAVGALALLMARDYVLVEEDFRVARFENRGIGQTPPEYEVPEIHWLTHLGAVLRAMRLRAEPDMDDAELALLHETARRFSWPPLHFRAALAQALNNQPDQAARQMRLIRNLYGDDIYREAAADFRRLQEEKYPALARVPLP
jgi:O-antigen ligase